MNHFEGIRRHDGHRMHDGVEVRDLRVVRVEEGYEVVDMDAGRVVASASSEREALIDAAVGLEEP